MCRYSLDLSRNSSWDSCRTSCRDIFRTSSSYSSTYFPKKKSLKFLPTITLSFCNISNFVSGDFQKKLSRCFFLLNLQEFLQKYSTHCSRNTFGKTFKNFFEAFSRIIPEKSSKNLSWILFPRNFTRYFSKIFFISPLFFKKPARFFF